MNKQVEKRILNIELQRKANDINREKRNYTKVELNMMGKANGIKYFCKYNKHDLAEKLGIELPELRSKQSGNRTYKKARTVEVTNPDGTTTTYPSIMKAAKALGKFPVQIYIMVAKDMAKFL